MSKKAYSQLLMAFEALEAIYSQKGAVVPFPSPSLVDYPSTHLRAWGGGVSHPIFYYGP